MRSRGGGNWYDQLIKRTVGGIVQRLCPNCNQWLELASSQFRTLHQSKKCIGAELSGAGSDIARDREDTSGVEEDGAVGVVLAPVPVVPYDTNEDVDMLDARDGLIDVAEVAEAVFSEEGNPVVSEVDPPEPGAASAQENAGPGPAFELNEKLRELLQGDSGANVGEVLAEIVAWKERHNIREKALDDLLRTLQRKVIRYAISCTSPGL